MATIRIPTVRLYVRERGGRRNFHPAPRVPDPSAIYWLRYENGGKQSWQRVGNYDSVLREKLLLERRLAAVAQGFILPEDQEAQPSSRVTIQAALDTYLESLRIKNRPQKTIDDKKRDVGYFITFCKKTYMDEIAAREMLGFRDHQLTVGYAERTVYNHLMTVATFLKKNGVYKITGLIDAEDWPELTDTDPDPYTEKEVQNLLTVASDFQQLIIRFFVSSGCREQEVAHLEWSDLDWIRKTVWIHAKPQYGWKPKTAAGTRRVPLSDALMTDLKAWQAKAASHIVFPSKIGGIQGHFLRMFKELGKLAEVSRVKCHRFRDTFITDLLRASVDLITIAKWAGHENLDTMKLYAATLRDSDEVARAAANRQERYTLGPQLIKTA